MGVPKITSKRAILVAGATGNIMGGAVVALTKCGAGVVSLGCRLETLESRVDFICVALSEEGYVFNCDNFLITRSGAIRLSHTPREIFVV